MLKFEFWIQWLFGASVVFAMQAASWALIGSFDPFGFYESYAASALWGSSALPDDARRMFAFAVIPLGATTCGFFVIVAMITREALARRERWAYRAVSAGIVTWFVLDTAFSAAHGAWFNIWIVNLPSFLVLATPLIGMRRHLVR